MNELAKRIGALALGHAAADFYLPVIPALLPALIPLFHEQGIHSYLMTSCLFTLVMLAMVIFEPLAGLLIDKNRFAPRLTWCILLSAAAISLYGVTQNYWVLFILAIVAGIGNSLYHPNAYLQVNQISSPSNRGTLLAVFSVGGSFGYAAAPIAAGFLYAWGGFLAVVLLMVPAIVICLVIRKHPQVPAPPDPVQAAAAEKPKWGRVSILLAINSLRFIVYDGLLLFAAVFLTEYCGVEYVFATGVVTFMLFAAMFGVLLVGPLSDKLGRKEILIGVYICAALSYGAIFVFSGTLSLAFLVISGFFLMASSSIEVAMIQEFMPGAVGFASGVITGIPNGVSALAMLGIGVLADFIGVPGALGALFFLLAAAFVLSVVIPYPMRIGKK
ncbi:MAG TPA: MFS transporter [Methanocorpusculum sp.]|nr:MFS transporter [Methanocorpusculum sp.]